jgi:hypothetical protein
VSDDDIILIKGAKSSRAVGTSIPIAFGFWLASRELMKSVGKLW